MYNKDQAMKSFKYFLNEQRLPGSVEFQVSVQCKNFNFYKYAQRDNDKILKALSHYQIIADADDDMYYYTFKNLNAQNGNEVALSKIIEIIEKNVSLEIDYIDSTLVCDGFPPYKLEWQHIDITFESPTQITGIDKYIGLFMFCNIMDCEKITGGVLSLLKIKQGTSLSLSADGPYPKWIQIINKHLKTRDLLACQEELIENGLEEYAKL